MTSALIYARDGRDFVVAALNHGENADPGWLHNIRSDAGVSLRVGRRTGPGRARIVSLGDPDYDRLWILADRNNHGRYTRYQQRTSRPIPIVVLTSTTSSPTPSPGPIATH